MAETGIMSGICTSTYSSPYPIEKVRDSSYPFNAGISIKTEQIRTILTKTDLFAISTTIDLAD